MHRCAFSRTKSHFLTSAVLNHITDRRLITGNSTKLNSLRQVKFSDKVHKSKMAKTLANKGLSVVWDSDSLDWKDLEASAITDRVLKRIEPGSIILFHNAAKNTPAALPSVIEGLIQQGYTMVPVSQLILRDNYTMDHTGRQIPGQS